MLIQNNQAADLQSVETVLENTKQMVGTFSFTMPLLPKGKVGQKSGIVATSMQGVIKTCRNGESGMWFEARPSFLTDVSTGRTIWFDQWVQQFVEGEGFAEGVKLLRMQDKVHGYHLQPENGEHPEWVAATEEDDLIDIQLKGDLPLSEGYRLDGCPILMDDYSVADGPHKDKELEELIAHEPGKRRLINQVEVTIQIYSFYLKEYKGNTTLMLGVDVVGVNLLTERLMDFDGETIQSYLDACTTVEKPKGTGRKKTGLKLIQKQAQKASAITESVPSTTAATIPVETSTSTASDLDISSMI